MNDCTCEWFADARTLAQFVDRGYLWYQSKKDIGYGCVYTDKHHRKMVMYVIDTAVNSA